MLITTLWADGAALAYNFDEEHPELDLFDLLFPALAIKRKWEVGRGMVM